MELTSYLLGKKAGGGGGGSTDRDWTTIGYSSEPSFIGNGFNYAKTIYDNWSPSTTTLIRKFKNDENLIFCPLIDTSNVTTTTDVFNACSNLIYVPLLNFSSSDAMTRAFTNCYKLTTIPLLDTSNVKGFTDCFSGCYSLVNVPLLNLSKATALTRMFNNCPNLSDDSLNNILKMCSNATAYGGTKTLKQLGFSSDNYNVIKISSLSNYQEFIEAGWSIGYE